MANLSRYDISCAILIVAEDFEEFEAFSKNLTFSLLDINGVRILDSSLSWLSAAQIQHCFIATKSAHFEKLETYIFSLHGKKHKNLRIEVVRLEDSVFTIADALRELESKYYFDEDFILMRANTLINADIEPMLRVHLDRKKKHPQQLMTKAFVSCPWGSGFKSSFDNFAVAYDCDTHEILSFQEMVNCSEFGVSMEELNRNGGGEKPISAHYDLIDPFFEIVSPAIFKILNDSFDWKYLRSDLLNSVLTKEIKEESVFLHCFTPQRGEIPMISISTPEIYRSVWRSQMKNLCSGLTPVSLPENAIVDISANLIDPFSVGRKSQILRSATLSSSKIGKNCTIGPDVRVIDSILLDSVSISEGASVLCSMICSNVIIGSNSVIPRGCLVAEGVFIASETTWLLPESYIFVDADGAIRQTPTHQLQASYFFGHIMPNFSLFNSVEDALQISLPKSISDLIANLLKTRSFLTDSRKSNAFGASLIPFGAQIEDDTSLHLHTRTDDRSIVEDEESSVDDCAEVENSDEMDSSGQENFSSEVLALVLEGLETPAFMQHKVLEIKGYRMVCNKLDGDVIWAFMPAILEKLALSVGFDKEACNAFIMGKRLNLLFQSFCLNDQNGNFTVFDNLLKFCKSRYLSDRMTENPYYGRNNFCLLCEMIENTELFDFGLFPRWYDLALKDDPNNVEILNNPRIIAFIEWLQDDE